MYFPFRSISYIDILLLATLFNWFNNFISLTLQNHIYLWYIYISLNHLHLIYIYIYIYIISTTLRQSHTPIYINLPTLVKFLLSFIHCIWTISSGLFRNHPMAHTLHILPYHRTYAKLSCYLSHHLSIFFTHHNTYSYIFASSNSPPLLPCNPLYALISHTYI